MSAKGLINVIMLKSGGADWTGGAHSVISDHPRDFLQANGVLRMNVRYVDNTNFNVRQIGNIDCISGVTHSFGH